MKKRGILFLGCAAVLLFSTIQACKQQDGIGSQCGGDTKISSFNSNESSRMSGNCMNCHGPGGSGEGCFSAAGTVYDSLLVNTASNAIVLLYTKPRGQGSVVATLEVDNSGNFYTTNNIDFSVGLYPAVTYSNGKTTEYMPAAATSGQCNSCHGVTNAKIWVK